MCKRMPIPANTKPFNRSFMREEVYNTLLSWIMKGKLRPGEKLLDKELAESMGVSRTPVREALRRLEDKDLVVSSANRWTRVSEISIKEPEMIYPIIWALEALAVSLAMARLTDADIKKMKQANIALGKALDEEDPVKASQADLRFHDVFIERADNPHIVSILSDLKIRCRMVEATYFGGSACSKYSMDEHDRIMEALKSRDVTLAQSMIEANWKNSLTRIRDVECPTSASQNHHLRSETDDH